jgi:hypothetical protein
MRRKCFCLLKKRSTPQNGSRDLEPRGKSPSFWRWSRAGETVSRGARACQRHAIEKAQRADDLVERRPSNTARHQVNLLGSNVLQPETIWGDCPKCRLNKGQAVDSAGDAVKAIELAWGACERN